MSLANETSDWHCNYKGKHFYSVKLSVFFLASAIGFLGNAFIITLAVKYTAWKNLHHLIINMAATDIFTVLVYLSNVLETYTDYLLLRDVIPKESMYGLCKANAFFVTFFPCNSVITLLIISIERFKATRRTLQMSSPFTFKRRLVEVCVSWVASFVLAMFPMLHSDVSPDFTKCAAKNNLESLLYMAAYYITLTSSCITVFTLNTIVMKRFSQREAIEESLSHQQRKMRADRAKNVVKMVTCSLIVHCLCVLSEVSLKGYLTFGVLNRNDYQSIMCKKPFFDSVYVFMIFLPVLNTCINPLIYIVFLRDFRDAAKRLLCKRCNVMARRSSVDLTWIN